MSTNIRISVNPLSIAFEGAKFGPDEHIGNFYQDICVQEPKTTDHKPLYLLHNLVSIAKVAWCKQTDVTFTFTGRLHPSNVSRKNINILCTFVAHFCNIKNHQN